MAYEKLLNEIYAAISLKYLWPKYQPCFTKCESPDWINKTMNFGMEVSQALMPVDGQTESFIEQYLGCLKEEIPSSKMEHYGERLHFYNGRFWAVLPARDEDGNYCTKAIYRFNSKLHKLNTNYQNFACNGLYLFMHPREGDEIEVQQIFKEMQELQKEMPIRFDYVFLNCIRTIYVFDFANDVLEPIVLPGNALEFLEKEAERLRNVKDWENGMEI